MDPRTYSIECSRCGRPAATFILRPPEGASNRCTLAREGFLSTTTLLGSEAELSALFESLRAGRMERLEGRHQDFTAFRCRTCGQAYCEECWSVGQPLFDEGFYDRTPGICPSGHEQTLDD